MKGLAGYLIIILIVLALLGGCMAFGGDVYAQGVIPEACDLETVHLLYVLPPSENHAWTIEHWTCNNVLPVCQIGQDPEEDECVNPPDHYITWDVNVRYPSPPVPESKPNTPPALEKQEYQLFIPHNESCSNPIGEYGCLIIAP